MQTTNRNWKVESISHLAFNPTDMDKTLKFYCDGFGFKKKALLTYADYEKPFLKTGNCMLQQRH